MASCAGKALSTRENNYILSLALMVLGTCERVVLEKTRVGASYNPNWTFRSDVRNVMTGLGHVYWALQWHAYSTVAVLL